MLRELRVLMPNRAPKDPTRTWGDQYFADALVAAFERENVNAHMHHKGDGALKRTKFAANSGAFEFVMRGKLPYFRLFSQQLMWLFSNPDTLTQRELDQCAHIFVASERYVSNLRARGASASVLHQCTDPDLFHPLEDAQPSNDVVFVGNRRKDMPRDVVFDLLDAGFNLKVWGRGWKNDLPEDVFQGEHIPNHALGQVYARAGVVVGDHQEQMLKHAFPANRIFDVLACGTAMVTDLSEGIPSDIAPFLYYYTDKTSLRTAVAQALAEDQARKDARRRFAIQMRETHSFDQRARTVITTVQTLETNDKTSTFSGLIRNLWLELVK